MFSFLTSNLSFGEKKFPREKNWLGKLRLFRFGNSLISLYIQTDSVDTTKRERERERNQKQAALFSSSFDMTEWKFLNRMNEYMNLKVWQHWLIYCSRFLLSGYLYSWQTQNSTDLVLKIFNSFHGKCKRSIKRFPLFFLNFIFTARWKFYAFIIRGQVNFLVLVNPRAFM